MEDNVVRQAGEYKKIGLIANPFELREEPAGMTAAQALTVQAMANRMVAAVDQLSEEARSATLWVDRSNRILVQFQRTALIDAEETLIRDESLAVLPAYVQLFVARLGRVRSIYNTVAERLAMRSFDQTLASWLRVVVDNPDPELPEYDSVVGAGWDGFKSAVEADALQVVHATFGQPDLFREIELTPPADLRPVNLEPEPAESEESDEDGTDIASIPGESDPDKGAPDALAEYVIAYTKRHLSPVIARGLRVYSERGVGPMSDELKITNAPMKSLKAVVRLARLRFRKIVVILDGYDNWQMMDEGQRIKYMAALTEVRLNLGKDAVFVFLVNPGQADDLDENFGGGNRLVWDYPGIYEMGPTFDVLTEENISTWVAAAALPGQSQTPFEAGALAELAANAGGDFDVFREAAAALVEDAKDRGRDAIA